MLIKLLQGKHDSHKAGDVFEMPADSSWLKSHPHRFLVVSETLTPVPESPTSPEPQSTEKHEESVSLPPSPATPARNPRSRRRAD